MKLRLAVLVGTIVLTNLLLAGCGGSNVPDPHVQITSPENGSVIYVSQTASDDPDTWHWNPGVVTFTAENPAPSGDSSCPYPPFMVGARDNGLGFRGLPLTPPQLACSTSAPGPFSMSWIPSSLGLNTLSAEVDVFLPNGSSVVFHSSTITVCVLNDARNPVQNIPIGTTSSTCFPHPPTPTAPPNPIDSVQAYPNPIYYGDTCPSLTVVTFRAALILPAGTTPDLVTVAAHVSVVIGPSETNEGNLLVPMIPNGTWDTATGGQVFLGTLDLSHRYNDPLNHFDPASLGGSPGALLWYADVARHDPSSTGTIIGRSLNQVLDLSPCPVSGHGPSPHTGGGTPSVCGYTNATSCNLAGCSWNSSNSTCSVTP